jgi:hypothetical protein
MVSGIEVSSSAHGHAVDFPAEGLVSFEEVSQTISGREKGHEGEGAATGKVKILAAK